ncbi:hypothetical protein HYT04_01980 [Candidatus Kaiserbacteria bacterium]|nr:hypothetical protein [Candidatus Kaiserbacteria bacterium]
MQLLITTPHYDEGTHYLHAWSQLLIEEAKRKGAKVKVLEREDVTRDQFQSYLKKQPFNLVVLNGHGNEYAVAGKSNEEIILATDNGDNLFENKIIYTRACSSGVILGHVLIEKGAEGFVGYIRPFIIPLDPDYMQKPLEDPYAGPILECSNQVAISLIKGHSAEEAHKRSLSVYEQKFDELSSSKVATTHILPFLLWNMDAQVHY